MNFTLSNIRELQTAEDVYIRQGRLYQSLKQRLFQEHRTSLYNA